MGTDAAPAQVLGRNNVTISGDPQGRPILFSHGYGCSQAMWRHVVPEFEADHRVIAFDLVGAGDSDPAAYDATKYDSLHGYADDVLDLVRTLDLRDAVFVGHSVSSMIGVLAAIADPDRFGALILVGPSPRYVDDDGYVGGSSREDIDSLLIALDANPLGWSAQMSHHIVGNGDRPELAAEWEKSFCRIDPEIARQFARVTFLSDNRADLSRVTTPTLVVQSREDLIAPAEVGAWVHAQIPGSSLTVLDSSGHIPNLSAPDQLAERIRAFLR